MWANERFTEHKDLLLRLMTRFGLAVPIRGKAEFIIPPLLVFGGQNPPLIPVPTGALWFMMHFTQPNHTDENDNDNFTNHLPGKSLWQAKDLQNGFLPASAFHQLCVCALGWCFHTVIGFEPSIGRSHAFVRFGRHQVLLSRKDTQPQVRVQLFVDGTHGGSLEVLDRLRLLLPQVLRHFPNLRCSFLLPLRDGVYVHHEALALVSSGNKPVFFPGEHNAITSTELAPLLQPWLPAWTNASRPHVFISYRWGPHDSTIADLLFETLSADEVLETTMCVFQDKRRLQNGDRFDFQFMAAMENSLVIVPLVSWDALKRMTTLTPISECDNVLLEWTLALELHARKGTKILPLLIGSQSTDGDGTPTMANFFAERPPKLRSDGRGNEVDMYGVPVPDTRSASNRVPHVVVVSVYERLDAYFLKKGEPVCAVRRCANDIVSQLSLFLAVLVWEIQSSHGSNGTTAAYERWGRTEVLASEIKDVVLVQLEQERVVDGVAATAATAAATVAGGAGAGADAGAAGDAAGGDDGMQCPTSKKERFKSSAMSVSEIVLLEGSLLKRSKGVIKRWQKRYFVVAGNYLKYSDSEVAARDSPRASVDLRALHQCTLGPGAFVTLNFGDLVLELQAATEEDAGAWYEVLARFEQAKSDSRKSNRIQLLEHYAPRKGSLVFERKSTSSTGVSASADMKERVLARPLKDMLASQGLSDYFDTLVDNGWETIDDVSRLSEEELVTDIGMKKGHARRLKAAISS
jgi:hypothetical protein